MSCLSYLEMKRTSELICLQSKRVMCVSYLKSEKARAFLKNRKCLCSRRDAKDARRDKVPESQRERSQSVRLKVISPNSNLARGVMGFLLQASLRDEFKLGSVKP